MFASRTASARPSANPSESTPIRQSTSIRLQSKISSLCHESGSCWALICSSKSDIFSHVSLRSGEAPGGNSAGRPFASAMPCMLRYKIDRAARRTLLRDRVQLPVEAGQSAFGGLPRRADVGETDRFLFVEFGESLRCLRRPKHSAETARRTPARPSPPSASAPVETKVRGPKTPSDRETGSASAPMRNRCQMSPAAKLIERLRVPIALPAMTNRVGRSAKSSAPAETVRRRRVGQLPGGEI